jgi:N-methylhydantoinase A/oxoprolinase/acetone carboxylase beta subunit
VPTTGPRTLLLGIDTGGTYTDAVIYDEHSSTIVITAKAPTTHHDLSIGIRGAIDAVLEAGSVDPALIELVSLSTTLATNALVEGRGRPVGAVVIGFDTGVVERAGLSDALAGDPVVFLDGGHDPHGSQVAPVDLEALAAWAERVSYEVDAFAVTSQFSVRNPEHELAAARLLRDRTGQPVTCSHQLSAQLNGPKRAVTAVLNARLIAIVHDLVGTTERTLLEHGIHAPLMVVRGDGSLVSAGFVGERPIETILSGPAASLVGAAHLTGLTDAIISDIGGTTTDIAVLRGGVPAISAHGAMVGGHRTMVAAVDMATHGLGGDSEVRHDDRAAGPVLLIGPRRIVPISALALTDGPAVLDMLERQLSSDVPADTDTLVLLATDATRRPPSDPAEQRLVERLRGPITPATGIVTSATTLRVVDRLVRRGVLRVAGFTPTDAAHVLGMQDTYHRGAAELAAAVVARRRDRLGRAIGADARALAELTVATLQRRSAEAVLTAAFVHDGLSPDEVAREVVQAGLDRRSSATRIDIGLAVPLVALGASAHAYYPGVAELLGTRLEVPTHAGVANAVGAVVGRVRLTRTCTISAPQAGQYLVHAGDSPTMHTSLDQAVATAEHELTERLGADMRAAGASEFEISRQFDERTVDIDGLPFFVEGVLTLTASGRPDVDS